MAQAQSTHDHDTIRRWTEERDGHPASVSSTMTDEEAGLLRIDFPGYSGEETLEEISWDDFFQKFDEQNLEFLYQEETPEGEVSRFCKLVSRKPR